MSAARQKVAIIGAGPCGIAACKSLKEAGQEFECFEVRSGVGGIWNVEDREGGGYRSLHTNTSKRGMSYSDFPFQKVDFNYPDAQEMVGYFNAYVRHFDLTPHIQLGVRVVKALPLDGGGWRLEFEEQAPRDFRALIVATGQYNAPRNPHESIPGRFSGEHLHVFDYLDSREPVDCRAKRVLVVGLGSSAAEVAAELSDPNNSVGKASQVILSARSGRWVLPKIIDGKPLDAMSPHPSAPVPAPLRMLPLEWGAWAMRRALAAVIKGRSRKRGGATALGLPEPAIEPWEDRPTMSLEFIPALEEGRIEVRPGIRSFEGRSVQFTDGSSREVDVILYATGYQLRFPFLDRETLACDAPDLELYQRIAHPDYDDLFFLGACRVMCSMWPLAEQQSRWIARLLGGAFSLPIRETRKRCAVALTQTLPVMCNFYIEGLRREAKGLELEP